MYSSIAISDTHEPTILMLLLSYCDWAYGKQVGLAIFATGPTQSDDTTASRIHAHETLRSLIVRPQTVANQSR